MFLLNSLFPCSPHTTTNRLCLRTLHRCHLTSRFSEQVPLLYIIRCALRLLRLSLSLLRCFLRNSSLHLHRRHRLSWSIARLWLLGSRSYGMKPKFLRKLFIGRTLYSSISVKGFIQLLSIEITLLALGVHEFFKVLPCAAYCTISLQGII